MTTRPKNTKRARAVTRDNQLPDYSQLPALTPDQLLTEAIRHYNQLAHICWWTCWQPAERFGSDHAFLVRIQENWARHMLTRYELQLEALAGDRVGRDKIRAKVDEVVKRAYPWLYE